MTLAARYAAGVAGAGAAGMMALASAPDSWRLGMIWGLLAGLLLQAPLGWWTLRSIGTERFLTVWGLGMLARLGVLLIAALALRGAPEPLAPAMLVTMVGVLLVLLVIEGAVAMLENSREGER